MPNMTTKTTEIAPESDVELSTDIVWGIQGIAVCIDRSNRQTHRLLEAKKLPAKKIGGNWVASKRQLYNWLINVPPPEEG